MTKLIKNIIRGAGTVVEIAPDRGVRGIKIGRFYAAKRDGHSIRNDWARVGRDIKRVANSEMKSHVKKDR